MISNLTTQIQINRHHQHYSVLISTNITTKKCQNKSISTKYCHNHKQCMEAPARYSQIDASEG